MTERGVQCEHCGRVQAEGIMHCEHCSSTMPGPVGPYMTPEEIVIRKRPRCAHPDGCDRAAEARRLCVYHYSRCRLDGTLEQFPLESYRHELFARNQIAILPEERISLTVMRPPRSDF